MVSVLHGFLEVITDAKKTTQKGIRSWIVQQKWCFIKIECLHTFEN